MNLQMKALCKQSYPYGDGGGGLGLTIDSKHQNFLSGKTYDIIDSIWNNNEQWYVMRKESGGSELFSPSDFPFYFVTMAEMRKDKLQRINDIKFLCGD